MIDEKFEAFTAEWIGELGVLNKKINELPGSLDKALLPTKTLLGNLSAQLNELPGSNDEAIKKLREEINLTSLKIKSDLATFNAAKQRTPSPSLWPYAIGFTSAAISFGAGILFSSSAISSSWVIGLLIGFVAGGALAILAINRIENKYGANIDAETAAIKADFKEEINKIKTVIEFEKKRTTEHAVDYNDFKKKIFKKIGF